MEKVFQYEQLYSFTHAVFIGMGCSLEHATIATKVLLSADFQPQVEKILEAVNENTKIIFLSAKSRQEDIDKGLALGADKYVTKPFSTKQIMQEIITLVNS